MNVQAFFQEEGKQQIIEKHEHVFMQGDDDDHIYLVQSGLLKAYYVSADGRENIKSFILPGDTIGSLSAAYQHSSCSFNLLALQNTQLTKLSFKRLFEAAKQSQDLANKLIEILLSLAMKKERREYELLCMPAEERYRNLWSSTPELFEAVTQNDIARYLGITPVALSRIKKRVGF